MNKLQFTRQDTNIAKGIFIIMMAVHHLFFDNGTFAGFSLSFAPLNSHQAVVIAQYFRICVGGFAFLTFYGMTVKFMQLSQEELYRKLTAITVRRYITLVTSFFFVYILSALTAVILKKDLSMLYSREETSWLGYGILDAVGMADFFKTPTLNVTWWYMSFAVVILFLFPIFYIMYEKLGAVLVIAMIFIPATFILDQTYLGMCAFSMALGILCARKDLFVRLREAGAGKLSAKLLKVLICALLFLITYQLLFYVACSTLYYGIGAALWTYIGFEFLAPVKILNKIFAFLGKHSLNIFLVHTFFYYYYARDFIYSFGHGLLVVLVLLLCSLAVSVLIELLKKLVRYQKAVDRLQEFAGQRLL